MKYQHIPRDIARKFLEFGEANPLIGRAQARQKLNIFDFVADELSSEREPLLEIGCGHGLQACLLTRYGRVSATELQVSEAWMGDRLKEVRDAAMDALAESPIDFRYNDGAALPFDDESFGLVFHNSVIEHVPDLDRFNREVVRVLKPGGVCLCITGTPVLCTLRMTQFYLLSPFRLALRLARDFSGRGVDAVLARHVDAEVEGAIAPRHYARLTHYLRQPEYNRTVLESLLRETGMNEREFLGACLRHFRGSLWNRVRYYATAPTHGQHYIDVLGERRAWQIGTWHRSFARAGFAVERTIPFRYHHVLELTPWLGVNQTLYNFARPLIRALKRLLPPAFASEVIFVVRKPVRS